MRIILNKLLLLINLTAVIGVITIFYLYYTEANMRFFISFHLPNVKYVLNGTASYQTYIVVVILGLLYVILLYMQIRAKPPKWLLFIIGLLLFVISVGLLVILFKTYHIYFQLTDDILFGLKIEYFFSGLILKFDSPEDKLILHIFKGIMKDKWILDIFKGIMKDNINYYVTEEKFKLLTTPEEIDEIIDKVFNAYISKGAQILMFCLCSMLIAYAVIKIV